MSNGIIEMAALRRLLETIGGDPEDLCELIEDFQGEAPELAARISEAAANGDLEALRIATHTLKSNARDFGATRLATLCEELEHECRTGAVTDPGSHAQAIAVAEMAAREALCDLSADEFL